MKIGVVGSRSFKDYRKLENILDEMNLSITDLIVSGGCPKGADALAERYAQNRRLAFKAIPANREKSGWGASLRRDFHLVRYADSLVIFWNGVSGSVQSIVDLCLVQKKPFRVVLGGER